MMQAVEYSLKCVLLRLSASVHCLVVVLTLGERECLATLAHRQNAVLCKAGLLRGHGRPQKAFKKAVVHFHTCNFSSGGLLGQLHKPVSNRALCCGFLLLSLFLAWEEWQHFVTVLTDAC